MATPVIKKFNSSTWQFSSPATGTPCTPAELFAAASAELARTTIMVQLAGTDISKTSNGSYVLTLYFSTNPT